MTAEDRRLGGVRAIDGLSAAEVIGILGLEYLEGEGIWFRLLWRTDHGNAIYALVTPEAFSALHVLREDETWVHVAGAPLEMLLLHPGGRHEVGVIGPDIRGGEFPTWLVPAGTWQGAVSLGEWSLVVCTLAPPFSGFTLADRETDLSEWSSASERIARLIRD